MIDAIGIERMQAPLRMKRFLLQKDSRISPRGRRSLCVSRNTVISANEPSTSGDSGSNAKAKHSRVAVFVEPSPFSHVSGMKNRFECLIKGLR